MVSCKTTYLFEFKHTLIECWQFDPQRPQFFEVIFLEILGAGEGGKDVREHHYFTIYLRDLLVGRKHGYE